jgi:hypothetical protein
VFLLALPAFGDEGRLLVLLLDFNSEFRLAAIAFLVLADVLSRAPAQGPGRAWLESLELVLLMAIAFRAIGVDRFGHVHEKKPLKQLYPGLIKVEKEGFKNAFIRFKSRPDGQKHQGKRIKRTKDLLGVKATEDWRRELD